MSVVSCGMSGPLTIVKTRYSFCCKITHILYDGSRSLSLEAPCLLSSTASCLWYSSCSRDSRHVINYFTFLQFPLLGPQPLYSIHTWTEKPFRSSATTCCAFQAVNDIYLNLETGVIATSPSTYVATNVNLTNGVSSAGSSGSFLTPWLSVKTLHAPLSLSNHIVPMTPKGSFVPCLIQVWTVFNKTVAFCQCWLGD